MTALIGIFFPVASFIWTDFVAFYLYIIVMYRGLPIKWTKLLKIFHFLAWSVSGFCIILVGAFGHAGYQTSNDDHSSTSNTGGWCWIRAGGEYNTFYWELIGGKFVEWISCFFILPYLYIAVAYQLSSMEYANAGANTGRTVHREGGQPRQSQASSTVKNPISAGNGSGSVTSSTATPSLVNNDQGLLSTSALSNPDTNLSSSGREDTSSVDSNAIIMEHMQNSQGTAGNISYDRAEGDGSVPAPRTSFLPSSGSSKKKKEISFNRFYLKLAALPLVFFFIRLWGSLRMILHLTDKTAARDGFLAFMQAFFDPSQGFFNAILFVFSSTEDRGRFLLLVAFVINYIPFCDSCSDSLTIYATDMLKSSGGTAKVISMKQFPTHVTSQYGSTTSGRSTSLSENFIQQGSMGRFNDELIEDGKDSIFGSELQDDFSTDDQSSRLSNFSFDDHSIIMEQPQ